MVKYFFLLHFSFCILLQSQPTFFTQPLSPRIANYDIDVRLDESNKMLFGKEVLTWHNKSSDVISELQFHLYMNGFRNSKSTFMKESGGRLRGIKMDKDGWGYIDIKKITLHTGEDLTSAIQFIQPDDGNAEDKTVVRLPLPTPLQPGDSISLSIDFEEKLPQPPFARTGLKEEYFFVGQWFPKVGVYIDGKWNCHQFHATTEFFADFGVYNVRITVPKKNIVGATGLEHEVKLNGDGTATHYY
ncbi:MAG: M1 family peptidase, partial [Ignavibacteriales bacterium]|nr:M1 family peptidase [Ignavibacteriales bacterium]